MISTQRGTNEVVRSELVEQIQLFVALEVFHEHPIGRGVLRPVEDEPLEHSRHEALSAALDRLHRLGFRHGDGHLGNFILGNDGTTIRIIDYEQAVRNASCARDGCADQIFLTKSDVEHLRNGTSLSMNEAWRSAGAALGAKRGAHSSLRRFFLDGARKARTHIT